MEISQIFRSLLLTDPAIAAVVGTRIYPVKPPQGATYPLITFQQISGVRHGQLKGRASLASPRFQVDAWTKEGAAASHKSARELGELILARLEGLNERVVDTSVSPPATRLVSVEFDSDQDLFETDVNGGYYRHSADYFVTYQTGHG